MLLTRQVLIVGFCFLLLLAGGKGMQAAQPYDPPPLPGTLSGNATRNVAGAELAPPKPEFNYGVGYAVPWQAASGIHWRKNARLEYYANPPSPTWRWFTTGRGCPYDKGLHYGIGYPFTVGYQYPKYTDLAPPSASSKPRS